MKRYLLDTGIAGMYMDQRRGIAERARAERAKGHLIGIAAPVLSELAFRAEGSPDRDENLRLLRDTLRYWKLWFPSIESTLEYGKIGIELKRLGRTVGQNDMMIASVARTLRNCTVVSADGDFKLIPGLRVENWAEGNS